MSGSSIEALLARLSRITGDAFEGAGLDRAYGLVEPSSRPDLGQFQCSGALPAAKAHGRNPRVIASAVASALADTRAFASVSIAGPGFINLTLDDAFLAEYVREAQGDAAPFAPRIARAERVLIDYGGANVAKPLHVGHLRSAIIGEALKRIGRFVGHEVIGDVHLGDWGLQMGMLIHELSVRSPELPYFADDFEPPGPAASPVSVDDLEELYPAASARAKADADYMEAARRATLELQRGSPGYRALWRHIVDVSIADLAADYGRLDVEFDLWLGESDAQEEAVRLVAALEASGAAVDSRGALVIDVAEASDPSPVPPLLLRKSDGAFLYGTTDLATIAQRVRDYDPALMLYVVDARQATHLEQVYRAAHRVGIAPPETRMEHIAFGTMNGTDGRPFRTRAGGTMKLKELIALIGEHAARRVEQLDADGTLPPAEKAEIARMVGIATLKFADLSNHRTRDYVFDPERFSAFEGKTGPYLLYSAVRARSVLAKAEERGFEVGEIQPPASEETRTLALVLAQFPDAVAVAWQQRAPNVLCEYGWRLAATFNQFYHVHAILPEPDAVVRGGHLGLTSAVLRTLERTVDLLGMEVPARM